MRRASAFIFAFLTAPTLFIGCGDDKTVQPIVPRSHRIAFSSERNGLPQIFVVNQDGTDLNPVSSTPNAYSPGWAPNGRRIAFSDFNFMVPEGDVFVVSPAGSNQTNLTNSPGVVDVEPSWSPGGTKIAFTTNRDGNFEVYVMNDDGSNPQRLTTDPASDNNPLWSPRGDLIAFLSTRDGNSEIYIMAPDGSAQTRLTNSLANEVEPAWSPDGALIAFRSDRGGNADIYAVAADGSGESRLTSDTLTQTDPAWSRDGTRIAYMAPDGIHIMNRDGSNDYWVPNSTSNDHSPLWSPDGRLIAFVNLENSNQEIFVISPTGSGRQNLSQSLGDDIEPAWEP
jgi:Tol biopolymer transport system component